MTSHVYTDPPNPPTHLECSNSLLLSAVAGAAGSTNAATCALAHSLHSARASSGAAPLQSARPPFMDTVQQRRLKPWQHNSTDVQICETKAANTIPECNYHNQRRITGRSAKTLRFRNNHRTSCQRASALLSGALIMG